MNPPPTLSVKDKIIQYFTRMEFYRGTLGNSGTANLKQNTEAKASLWTMAVYVLASLGIFCRQITEFPKRVGIHFANLQWNVFFASLILGFALLPHIIRIVNKSDKDKPGFRQTISAFGVGFFIDFTTNGVIHYYIP